MNGKATMSVLVVAAGLVGLALILGSNSGPLQAGCQMNVYVKNTGSGAVEVNNRDSKTGAMSKGGFWRALRKGGWFDNTNEFDLDPGESRGDGYSADFACGKKRRFRVRYSCIGAGGVSFTDYEPGPHSWSMAQTVIVELKQCN